MSQEETLASPRLRMTSPDFAEREGEPGIALNC